MIRRARSTEWRVRSGRGGTTAEDQGPLFVWQTGRRGLELLRDSSSRDRKVVPGVPEVERDVSRPASKAFLAALRKNAGRSTTGAPAVPYYVESPVMEAVKHLRLTATRFLSHRASHADLDEAIRILSEARAAGDR